MKIDTISKVEEEILSDMQFDTHELWEWYSFIRTFSKPIKEIEVVEIGYNLLEIWINRNWLIFYPSRRDSKEIQPEDFLDQVKNLGEKAADPEYATMVLELSQKARIDIDWLKKAPLSGPA